MGNIITLHWGIFITLDTYSLKDIIKEGNEANKKEKERGFVAMPLVFYTPETSLGAGGMFLFYFWDLADNIKKRPSSLRTALVYTYNKQFITRLFPNIYLGSGEYNISGNISYLYFPNKFYGIGNQTSTEDKENYTSRIFYYSN